MHLVRVPETHGEIQAFVCTLSEYLKHTGGNTGVCMHLVRVHGTHREIQAFVCTLSEYLKHIGKYRRLYAPCQST